MGAAAAPHGALEDPLVLRAVRGKLERGLDALAFELTCRAFRGAAAGLPAKAKARPEECVCGGIPRLEWATRDLNCPRSPLVAAAAAYRGRLEELRWVLEQGFPCDELAAVAAARGGQRATLEHVLGIRPGIIMRPEICTAASGEGHLGLLKLLRERGCPWDEDTVALAARNGHQESVEWACGGGCPVDAEAAAAAAEGGHMGILKWLRTEREPPAPWDWTTTAGASQGGHGEILRWAHGEGCPISARTYACAAFSGDLNLLEFLDANGCSKDEVACLAAVAAGHPHVLRYLSRCGLREAVIGRRTVRRAVQAGCASVLACLRDLGAPGVPD